MILGTNNPDTILPSPVDAASITILMDNFSSLLVPDYGPAKRLKTKQQIVVSHLDDQTTRDNLVAEHGFSAWISITNNNSTHSILFDTGISPFGVSENMSRLELDPKNATALVMSHGHNDHTTGIHGIMDALPSGNTPIIIHPDFWNKRRIYLPESAPSYLPAVNRSSLIDNGFDVIHESNQPSFILGKSILITGEIDRTTPYEMGMQGQQRLEGTNWIPDPLTLDDQAIVINVKGKGLIIVTGCGHSGIVNITRYVKKITGMNKIHALIGGFHLPDHPRFQKLIDSTLMDLKKINPDWISPSHCTGFEAMKKFSEHFPTAFIRNSVGTCFNFKSGIEK